MKNFLFSILVLSVAFTQNDFILEDLNSSSDFFGNYVGPSTFSNEVSLVYFGHYN